MFSHDLGGGAELRLLEVRHAEELFALVDRNRGHLRPWMSWVDSNTSVDVVRAHIQQTLRQFAAGEGLTAGIWWQGTLAGSIGYNFIEYRQRFTEIGYWLGAEYQGRGLMTRACRAFVAHAFGELGLHRVEVHCATANTHSRAIPERLGFRNEGVLREVEWLYDHYVDNVVYGMLADEWQQVPSPST